MHAGRDAPSPAAAGEGGGEGAEKWTAFLPLPHRPSPLVPRYRFLKIKRENDMNITAIGTQLAGAAANMALGGPGAAAASAASAGMDFVSALDSALKGVSQSGNQADALQQQFQLGNPSVSLEQTMVAINKAQLNLSEAVQVRDRLTQAYSQIMNMQV